VLAILGMVSVLAAARSPLVEAMGHNVMESGPNGPQTPATVGLAFERVSIPSGRRRLDGYLVRAPAACADPPSLVIFHGASGTISMWVKAERLLYDHCVSSLVFDPTGSGNSPRPATHAAINEDARAVVGFMRRKSPGARLYLLGHSLGNGPLLDAAPHLSPAPDGIIVYAAFGSLKEAAEARPRYRLIAMFMPDWWDNLKSIKAVHAPILVMHSQDDEVIPVADGRALFAAANAPKSLVILRGFRHNDIQATVSAAFWDPVLKFMGAPDEARRG
jgi:alpha-beta hydrolase superfamily lysophospholipase